MKILIVGCFAYHTDLSGGQAYKTRALSDALRKHYGPVAVTELDTVYWTRHPVRLLVSLLREALGHDTLIMLPASRGLRVFAPILYHFKKHHRKRIFYDVIGGWLPEHLQNSRRLTSWLKAFDGIWTETDTMKQNMEALGFSNVTVIPNFRDRKPLQREQLVFPEGKPLKLCTFSRLNLEKGIEDAVRAVKEVNGALGSVAFTLDIYGKADPQYEARLDALVKELPSGIQYMGCVAPEKSVETLKGYFALLFPTRYATEGVPGTVLDAYTAGVPVIASRWNSFADVIDEGKTGIGYAFQDVNDLKRVLLQISEDPVLILSKKVNCLEKAALFQTEQAIRPVIRLLEGDPL